MPNTQSTYHAPVFEPTVDELAALKQLELEPVMTMPEALRQHLSGRLLEWGYIHKTPGGGFALSDSGRKLVQRQNN